MRFQILRLRGWVVLALAASLPGGASAVAQVQPVAGGGPGPGKGQHATVEMTANSATISPGETIEAGFVLAMEEHWHVLWIDAGAEVQPPRVEWTLPPGISAGPMRYPIPGRISYGPRTDFGYEYAIAFPVAITAARDLKAERVHLDAIVSWTVCSETCVPGRAHLGFELPVTAQPTPLMPRVGALGNALALIPKPVTDEMRPTAVASPEEIVLTLHTGTDEGEGEFYPAEAAVIDPDEEPEVESITDGVRLRLKRSAERTALPGTLRGLVKINDREAYDFVAPLVAGDTARDREGSEERGAWLRYAGWSAGALVLVAVAVWYGRMTSRESEA